MYVLIIFLFLQITAYANDEYIFSYQSVIKNEILVNEKLYLTKALTKKNPKFNLLCTYKAKDIFSKKSKENILKSMMEKDIVLRSYQTTTFNTKTLTIITIPPTRLNITNNGSYIKVFVQEN